jgi:hypothetical protein
MTDAVKERSIFATSLMSEEGSPALELPVAPIRLSGFVALALGIVSFVGVLGLSLMFVPLLAAVCAVYAVRPYQGDRPVGVIAGWIGLFCAIMFSVWGTTERHFKSVQMTSQATRYASEWLALLAQNEVELAVELQIDPSRRQPETMPLVDYYQRSPAALEIMKQFNEQETLKRIREAGEKPKWELHRPPLVFVRFGREITETVWKDTTGSVAKPIVIEMEYIKDAKTKTANWKVNEVRELFEGKVNAV